MRVLSGGSAAGMVAALAQRGRGRMRMEGRARSIVDAVRRGGDRALLRYARRLDGLQPGAALRVEADAFERARRQAPAGFIAALSLAAANIRCFCEQQKPREWSAELLPGGCVGEVVRPLASAGCYVPGGRYPLPSTLLMTVIPAQVAGVPRICVASPRPARETLSAAAMLGVTEFYAVGGAQAVAALAYGTESIAPVEKIVGPGNLYVTAAKKLVAFDVGIDFLAGPTEALIYAEHGDPAILAADLVAQAEHDPQALAVFLTPSPALAAAVAKEARRRAGKNAIARASLATQGVALVASSRKQAMEWANSIAPEHITVPADGVALVHNAGSIFAGDYSPQALGDYAAGPNHVLPTGAAARLRGGLSVRDFVKIIAVQQFSRRALERMAKPVIRLAEAEGLRLHAESVRVRSAYA